LPENRLFVIGSPSRPREVKLLLLSKVPKAMKKRLKTSTGGAKPRPMAKLPQADSKGKARDQAANAMNVSGKYVSQAKKLKAESPELSWPIARAREVKLRFMVPLPEL